MRESSIHIERGKSLGYFRHNDRSKQTKNSIFDLSRNEVSRSAPEAIKEWREEVERRAARYKERTGQKLNPRTATHLSAIVNLNESHTLDDVAKVAELLEDRFGVKVAQYAIHRDEGYKDPITGAAHINHHAHIEMVGIDEDGRSCRRKLTRSALSQLQSDVAELLNMPRGRNYAAERAPRPHRRDTYAYKAMKQAEEQERIKREKAEKAKRRIASKDKATAKEVFNIDLKTFDDHEQFLARVKDVKEEAKRLREELKAAEAERAQYAELEAEVRRLKELAKAKELTVSKLTEEMTKLRAELLETREAADRRAKALAEIGTVAGVRKSSQEYANATTPEERLQVIKNAVVEMRSKLSEREKELEASQTTIDTLKAENSALRADLEIYQKWGDRIASVIRRIAGRFGLFADGDDVEVALDLVEALDEQSSAKQTASKKINRSMKIKP